MGHNNGTAIRWKRSVLGVSCIARPVRYPHLYVLNSFARIPDVHFLVIAFGVVACAWRRERTFGFNESMSQRVSGG